MNATTLDKNPPTLTARERRAVEYRGLLSFVLARLSGDRELEARLFGLLEFVADTRVERHKRRWSRLRYAQADERLALETLSRFDQVDAQLDDRSAIEVSWMRQIILAELETGTTGASAA